MLQNLLVTLVFDTSDLNKVFNKYSISADIYVQKQPMVNYMQSQ